MQIRFQFNLDKALHAMAYLVDRLGAVDKVKLIKLLYIADRDCFLEHGYPITGDRQCAMKYGPVPSLSLNALNGLAWPNPSVAFDYLHVNDNKIMLKAKPVSDWLDHDEKAMLDKVLATYGETPTWPLCDLTHEFPEWNEVFVEGTSTTIPYELILKHYKGDEGFRHGRAVVTEATLRHMTFPFTAPNDSDL